MSDEPTSTPAAVFDWKLEDMPDQTGRVAVVTGASSGLGAVAAGALAARGSRVVMAVRDIAKGERVRASFRTEAAQRAVVVPVDLFDLDSVHRLADRVLAEHGVVDVLLNNAGVASEPHRVSREGVEGIFAANVVGPHLLTQRLLDAIDRAPDGRVVGVSSNLYRRIKVDLPLSDLDREASDTRRYVASKLADLLLAQELERRLRLEGRRARSFAVHPGVALTPMNQQGNGLAQRLLGRMLGLALGRTAEAGALPLLFAASAPEAPVGRLLGPSLKKRDLRVHADTIVAPGDDHELARRLWETLQRIVAGAPTHDAH